MNTIDELGEEETFRLLIERNITEFEDNEVTSIGQFAFFSFKSLASVAFPSVTRIGSDAFRGCTSLVNVTFPSVITVYGHAFERCTSLTSVSFPCVTLLSGQMIFHECKSLTTMYIGTESDTVCTLSQTDAIPSNVANIYVPAALVDSYKTATNWSYFADKIKGYEQPVACQSLTITADDVAGYQTTTTIHWEATCTYSIEGIMQPGTMVFKGDAVSDAFSKNPSSDSSRSIEVSYTFLGQTATTTITQSKYIGESLGGTIFYIDDTADGAYEFYDAEGNIISSVAVGDSPAFYKVLTPGIKDKYYVCNTTLYPSLQWGMEGTSTGATGTAIGTGKSNTNTVMATSAATTLGTIWHKLTQARSNSLEGYTDWFVPSKEEVEAVSTSGVMSLSGKYIWSSSEYNLYGVWVLDYGSWEHLGKTNTYSVFFVRAF